MFDEALTTREAVLEMREAAVTAKEVECGLDGVPVEAAPEVHALRGNADHATGVSGPRQGQTADCLIKDE
jgi:hypothetical protein